MRGRQCGAVAPGSRKQVRELSIATAYDIICKVGLMDLNTRGDAAHS